MGCKECGKPKCNGECGCKSPKVLQINNPAEYITFHKVSIPAAMGDSTTNPPKIGAYRNALVYYEADHTSWMYSTDGIPTLVTGEQGPTGPQGPAGTIAIGTTTTGAAGEDASVENVGTPENAILDFTIPRGEQGEQGPQGEPGPQGYMNEQDVRDVVDTIVPEGFFDDEATVSDCGAEFELENLVGGTPVSLQLEGDTFQQSYEGKNLANTFDMVEATNSGLIVTKGSDGAIILNGTQAAACNIRLNVTDYFSGLVGEDFTISVSTSGVGAWSNFGFKTPNSAIVPTVTPTTPTRTVTLTTSSSGQYWFDLYISNGGTVFADYKVYLQVEKGTTATSYEPFVGGQPSPNPAFPQPIQTVTGLQTISINGTDYPISLGSIELCKLGTYKDYIYKDGDSWKVHKEIGHDKKIVSLAGIDGYSSVYGTATTSNGAFAIISTNWGSDYATTAGLAIASSVIGVYQSQNIDSNNAANSMTDGTFCQRSGTNDRVYFRFASLARSKTVNEVNQMITDNGGIDLWYPLTTPTDTTITDQTLVAQLEAIRLESGYNAISLSSDGLIGELCIDAYANNWNGTISSINNELGSKADKAVVERKPFYFNSLAEMKVYDLNDGDLAITTGYYFADDGGAAEYIITDEELTADDAFVVALANGNFAKLLVKDNCINIRQIGARSQDAQNNKYDIAAYISAYIAYLDTIKDRVKLYIPSGVWYSSPLTIHRKDGFSIFGDEQFVHWVNGGTIISSLADNQDFIFKFGDLSSMMGNFTLKNICFTTADFVYDSTANRFVTSTGRIKNIALYCVVIQGCEFGDIDNLYFQHINGQALEIATAWEIRYRKLYFRDIDSHAGCIMKFGEKRTTLPISYVGGVNASSFDNLMFEQVLGHLIELDYHCELVNCYFGVINFEDNQINRDGVTYTDFTSSNISDYEASNPTRYAMFYGGRSGITFDTCVINSIQLNNISSWYSTIDETNYCYDNLFRFIGDWSLYQIVINNIDSLGIRKDATILYSHDKVDYRSSFIINNLNNTVNNNYEFIYDVDFFRYIRNDGRIRAITNSWVARLPESATPAYKLVVNRNSGQGKLKSDKDAQNELRVCVKLVDTGTSMSFYNCSDKLAIRAKIPAGETAKIGISGTLQQDVDLAGTGSFEVYEIALSSNRKIGDLMHISFNSANTATSCLIDYIIN